MTDAYEIQRQHTNLITDEEKVLFDRLKQLLERYNPHRGYVSVTADSFSDPKEWYARDGAISASASQPYDALRLLAEERRAEIAKRYAELRVMLAHFDEILGEPKSVEVSQ